MKSVFKSVVLILLGGFLASVAWHLSVVPELEQGHRESIAKAIESNREFKSETQQNSLLTSAVVYLAMDLQVLRSPPQEIRCLIREFAEMKYQTVLANRNGVQPHEEPTIKDYEALEENTACSNR